MNKKKYFINYLSTQFDCNTDLSVKRLKLEYNTFDRNIKEFLPPKKNSRILEIGFGTGYLLKYLIEECHYRNVFGIEYSLEETDFVKKNITKNVKCVDCTESFLDKRKKNYDLIIITDVLEHVEKEEVVSLLTLIRESLTSNGVFIARCPNGTNPLNIGIAFDDFTHQFLLTKKSFSQILKLAEFRSIEILEAKEENITLHGKITNFLRTFIYQVLVIIIGLNRAHVSSEGIYSKNLYCIAKP